MCRGAKGEGGLSGGKRMTQCERMTVQYYHLQVNRMEGNISVALYTILDIRMIDEVTGSDEDDKPGKILRTTVGRSVGAAE
jgi:hypothetical protein